MNKNLQEVIDAELLYRKRGRLLYDDSMHFKKVNDFIFLLWGVLSFLCFLGLGLLIVWFGFSIYITRALPMPVFLFTVASIFILAIYLITAFMTFLFFYVLRTNPIKVYENGFELGWKTSPEYHPYSHIQEYKVEDKGDTINIKFKSYKTYSVSFNLPADYQVSRRSPLLFILQDQFDKAWDRSATKRKKEARVKALVWAAKAEKQEKRLKKFELVKNTRNGVGLTLVGFLWTFFFPLIGQIMVIAGMVNFYKGRNEYGPGHSRNVLIAMICYITGWLMIISGTVISVFSLFTTTNSMLIAGNTTGIIGIGLILAAFALNVFIPSVDKAKIAMAAGLVIYQVYALFSIIFTITYVSEQGALGQIPKPMEDIFFLWPVVQFGFFVVMTILFAGLYINTERTIDEQIDREVKKDRPRKKKKPPRQNKKKNK